jgi:hypothetical protein
MKKFLVTYHAPVNAMEQTTNVPPEQMAKGMELWMNWAKRCGDKLLDMGSPLVNGQSLHPDGSVHKSTKQVCGYSIVQAENMDEAKGLMAGHPHTSGWSPDATIEVHEQMIIPGM